LAGMSLSDYLIEIIAREAEKPTLEEFRERLRRRQFVNLDGKAAEFIREQRGPI